MAVITRPKQTPSSPSAPGRPKVRTANSFRCGKISTITGLGRLGTVAFAERLLGPAQQVQDALAVEVGLARIHADDESIALERAKPGDAVPQRDRLKATTL